PDQRFFLALLQNLPDRDAIYALVEQRYPGGSPRERVAAWIQALSGIDQIGVNFDDQPTRHIVLALLDGCSTDGMLERLAQVFEPGEVKAHAEGLHRHAGRI